MPFFASLDRLKAELDALRPLAPEQEQRVLQKFRLDWNYHSNAIEGNSLTLGETRSLLLHGLTAEGKPLRDHLDIKGHNEAILGLEEIVHDDRPLTEQFIREMHQVLLGEEHYKSAHTASGQPTRQRIVPGQYKTSTNNVVTATGETFYFASPEETPAKMHDFLTWYRQEVEAPTLHPVALAAEFHHRFVSIHPFDDGNGRMSRLLMNLILVRHGYPIAVIKADETTRNRYLAALSEADAGEPEPFLRFIIENVEVSLQLMIRAAKGESIDEPSDLDKKLALLKKQVLNREDTIELVWGAETQANFYETIIGYWLDDLTQQMQRFDDLFIKSEFTFLHRAAPNKAFVTSGEIGLVAIQSYSKTMLEKFYDPIDSVALRFNWSEFRLHQNVFNMGAGSIFKFNKHSFEIFHTVYGRDEDDHDIEDELVFSSLYKTSYDTNRIQELNHQLANKVYDFVAAKVAEADTPPA